MEIVATKRLKDGLNFVIEYMEDGQLHCLFISAEKVVKYYKAVEQSVHPTLLRCPKCNAVAGWHHEACEDYSPETQSG